MTKVFFFLHSFFIRKTKMIIVFINASKNLGRKWSAFGPCNLWTNWTLYGAGVGVCATLYALWSEPNVVRWNTTNQFSWTAGKRCAEHQWMHHSHSPTVGAASPPIIIQPTSFMLLTSGGFGRNWFLNFRWTATGDFVSRCHNTHCNFCWRGATSALLDSAGEYSDRGGLCNRTKKLSLTECEGWYGHPPNNLKVMNFLNWGKS